MTLGSINKCLGAVSYNREGEASGKDSLETDLLIREKKRTIEVRQLGNRVVEKVSGKSELTLLHYRLVSSGERRRECAGGGT